MTGILLVHGAWHGVLGQAFGEVQHHGSVLASFRRKALVQTIWMGLVGLSTRIHFVATMGMVVVTF